MKTVLEHIEHARKKPHHIRKKIAFAVAGIATAFIALVWFIASFSLGAFAIQESSFADSTGRPSAEVVGSGASDNSSAGIAGAAAAIQSTDVPAHIEIIDAVTSTSVKKAPDETTIPF